MKELYVGDSDNDDQIEWDTVWEPSPYDDCIQEFVEYPDNETDEDDSDVGEINYKRLLHHLKKIAPHIDWRIEDKGYDCDDGGGCCWKAVAVPNEQLYEAESIIERIERSDDIMQFSGPEDFAGPIYDERGNLRKEITEFADSIKNLRSYILSGYLRFYIESRQEAEDQIIHLIRLLANLYAAGGRLTFLEVNSEISEYSSPSMPTHFQNFMMEQYGRYMENQDNNPFEDITIACEYLDEVQELYDDGSPYDIARAVADWQFGFRSGAGWASCVVDVLKPLHEILSGIRYKGCN